MNNRIWFISKYANIKKYGADTRQSFLCQEFAKKGYKPRLILSNSSHLHSGLPSFFGFYKSEWSNGVQIVWINTIKYKKATSIIRMISWVQFEFSVMLYSMINFSSRPNIVIASSLSLLSVFSGVFIKKILGSRFIFEVRDIWPQTLIDLKNLNKNAMFIRFLSKVEKLGYRQAHSIVGTMPKLNNHVEKICPKASNKVNFIPQGFSDVFYLQQNEVSREYKENFLSSEKFKVVYAGTLGQAYALESIINAAKLSEMENVQFIFVGDGIEKDNLMKSSRGLNNVIFAPRVDKAEVLSVLAEADVLLHSFRMKPVFEYGISPNKFIDYMYAEKPIICMFSGAQSILNEAGCGFFIESEDSQALVNEIIKLKQLSESERKKIGKKGREYLESHHRFQQLAEQYIRLF